ncbi:MAG TPA: hypothetical protein VNA69_01570 [Thermoanaerobaculia bacterium]|nr:hypothetical protein [Thermoanaerobaculia bacterium]
MSTNEKVVSNSESTAVSIESTNPHVEAAQARLQELRLMRDQIPRFLIPESSREVLRLTSAASVPPEFVELTVVAVANQKALMRGESATPAEIRDLLRYAEAYSPLADELEALAQFVRFSVNAARNTAGSEALTIYSLAQRLAKRRENAGLAPCVADMRRALGRTRKQSPEAVAKRAAAKAARAAEKAARAAGKLAKPTTAA